MSTQHTPGPWKAREDYGRHWVSAGKGKKAVQVADVSDIETSVGSGETDTDTKQTADNARLIAAAPDLLAACEAAAGLLRRLGGTNHDPEYSELLQAIAKAKGE